MNTKVRAVVCWIAICGLFVAGCESKQSVTMDRNVRAGADIQKAALLRELDKKWENPEVHYELGQLYHDSGDWSKAEWHYNIALGFNPALRDAQAAIVKLQFDRGDRAKGQWAADTYMTQASYSAEQTLALGVGFEKQGLLDYALKCYQDALAMAPSSPAVNRQLGYYYLARNQKDLAKDYFIRSFQINPNQPDVAGELGRLGVAVRIPEAAPPPASPSRSASPPAQQ